MDLQPFRISIPQADLDDLRDRLIRARWPDELPCVGWTRGVPLDYLQTLANCWASEFDWRIWEARLNAYPQITTIIDGQPVHALHARSDEPGALPLLLLHGWPSSFVEFVRLLDPLTDPVRHGGRASEAFHVVVPSIPGFGFSTRCGKRAGQRSDCTGVCAADARSRLLAHGAHGGDIGAASPPGSTPPIRRACGIHVASDPAAAISFSMFTGDPAATPGLSEAETSRVEQLKQASTDGMGYLQLQTTRPQTLAYALTDSPVGQLAWIVEKFKEWTDAQAPLPEQAVDRDQLLANVVSIGSRAAERRRRTPCKSMHAQVERTGSGAGRWAVFGADGLVRRLVDPGTRLSTGRSSNAAALREWKYRNCWSTISASSSARLAVNKNRLSDSIV
jgi:hypothetical protein